MDVMNTNFDSLYDVLTEYLGPQAERLMKEIRQGSDDNSDYMVLPTDGDLHPSEVSRLIALSANKYAAAGRLASRARGRAKMAEALYKHKFRTSLGTANGKNKEEREASAAAAAEQEYHEMVMAQVVMELCESIESANRIASESSRRMLLAADQMMKAESRFNNNSNALADRDFDLI